MYIVAFWLYLESKNIFQNILICRIGRQKSGTIIEQKEFNTYLTLITQLNKLKIILEIFYFYFLSGTKINIFN